MDNYSILEFAVMTGIVQKFPVPLSFYGAKYFPTPASAMIVGQTAKWDTVGLGRNMASYVAPGGHANLVSRSIIKSNTFSVAYKKEMKRLKSETMALLRAPGTENKQWAEQAIALELKDLDRRIQFLNEWENWQALNGTLTVNQSDIKFVIDYGIDSTHKPTVSATWATASTDIIGDIETYKKVIAQDSGEVAIEATVSGLVMSYMMKNTGVKNLMGVALNQQRFETGRIVRFLDLDWYVYDAGYVPDGGSFTPFLALDKCLITTAPTFGERIIGSSLDPKSGFKPGRFSKSWTLDTDQPDTFVLEEENSLACLKKVENLVMAKVVV